jgi:hypothetical protein
METTTVLTSSVAEEKNDNRRALFADNAETAKTSEESERHQRDLKQLLNPTLD